MLTEDILQFLDTPIDDSNSDPYITRLFFKTGQMGIVSFLKEDQNEFDIAANKWTFKFENESKVKVFSGDVIDCLKTN